MNDATSFKQIIRRGLWLENPGLVQLLGLCPLLAVSNTLINGLGLGVATLLVICTTNVLVSACRHWLHTDFRLPTFVLIIATFVTVTELLFKAFLFDLHLALGIFLPLIVTNCVILGRAEAFASRQPVPAALADGIAHGLGFAAVLIVLGSLRELIGYGGLLTDIDTLISPAAQELTTVTSHQKTGLLLAILPPGAFIGLAILIALRHALVNRMAATGRADDAATNN